MAKRSKTEPMLNSTLFQIDELGHAPDLPSKLVVEHPFYEPGVLLGTSASYHERFLNQWKDADADVPVLREAKD